VRFFIGGMARPTKAGPEELGDEDAVASQIEFYIKCPDKWHFFDSFLFSLITITTIGYGNQTPQTASGQMFCVVYSIFGIPLIGFFVYYWTKGINHFDTLHFRKLFRSSSSTSNSHSHTDHEDGDDDPNINCSRSAFAISLDEPARRKRRRTSKLLQIWIKVLTFFLFWYILPSTIFYFGEHGNWKWENAGSSDLIGVNWGNWFFGPRRSRGRKNKWPFAGDFALFAEIRGVGVHFFR